MLKHNQLKNKWILFWFLTGVEGIYFSFSIYLLPSESNTSSIFGLSIYRFFLFIFVLIVSILCFLFVYFLLRKKLDITSEFDKKIFQVTFWISLLTLFFVLPAFIVIQSPIGKIASVRSVFERLLPVLLWMVVYSGQMIIFLFWWNIKIGNIQLFVLTKRVITISLFFFVCTIIFIWFVLKTGFGLEIISGTFYRQGVSLLEGQIILPILLSIFAASVGAGLHQKALFGEKNRINFQKKIHILIPLIIWIATAIIWIRTPFEGRSYFLPALRPPNYNFYPSSDAENYDLLAQSILIGNGFHNGMTVVRPLYVALLTLLHCIAKNDYLFLTNLQIMILAIFPMMIYLIGKNIHHPLSGLLAAAWCIWREKESISITPLVQVSNSRLLMSDLPTALMICITIYAVIKWFQGDGQKQIIPLIAGGCCGVITLVRTQSIILMPAIILFSWIQKKVFKQSGKNFFKGTVFFLIGAFTILLPWNIHNQIFPNTSVNNNTSEMNYLYKLYEGSINQNSESSTISEDISEKPSLLAMIMKNPKPIFSSIISHFANNEISTLLIMPVREVDAENINMWFHDPSLFWYRESSKGPLTEKGILVATYCLIICLGIGFAATKTGWTGLLPLGIHIFYNLGTSFAMNSGFRFLLPVDWIGYFYFSIGIIGIICLLLGLYFQNIWNWLKPIKKLTVLNISGHLSTNKMLITMFFLLVIGFILPVLDKFIPYRYTAGPMEIQQYKLKTEGLSFILENYPSLTITELFEERKLEIVEGRAVYPRYYPANEGDSGASSSVKRPTGFGRIVWMLINQRINTISLPVYKSSLNQFIQDPMDVVVIGEQKKDYFDAWIIIGKTEDQTVIWESSFLRKK